MFKLLSTSKISCVKILESTTSGVFSSMEYIDCQVTSGSKSLRLAVVYRPPPSKRNGSTISSFLEEWQSFIERFTTNLSHVYILGDLNLHLDQTSNANTTKCTSTLAACGLEQLVKEPTHVKGHTLDVAITHSNNTNITDMCVSDPGFCDQYAISFSINISKPVPVKRDVSYRKLRSIDIQSFKDDLGKLPCPITMGDPLEGYNTYLAQYTLDHTLHGILKN